MKGQAFRSRPGIGKVVQVVLIVVVAVIGLGIAGSFLSSPSSSNSTTTTNTNQSTTTQQTTSRVQTTSTGLPSSGQPDKFAVFTVQGGNQSIYTVEFVLSDQQQHNVASDGTVVVRFLDARNNILYSETRQVSSSDYGQYTCLICGGSVLGYTWDIQPSQVKAGAPDALGYGTAEITFTAPSGFSFSDTYTLLAISSLPKVSISSVGATIDQPNWLTFYGSAGYGPYFAGDSIPIQMTLSYYSSSGPPSVTVTLSLMTSGFQLLGVTPSNLTLSNGQNVDVNATVKAPNSGYSGNLQFATKTTTKYGQPVTVEAVNVAVSGSYTAQTSVYGNAPYGAQYGSFNIQITVSYYQCYQTCPASIQVTAMKLLTQGFTIIKIQPTLPYTVSSSGSAVTFVVTIQGPSAGFDGPLQVEVDTT